MSDLFDYRQELDALRFTPEQKAALARRAAQAAQGAQDAPVRSRRPLRRTLVIAAAAVLVLAVGTAGATGVLKSAAEVFSPLFGGSAAQTEIIDKIGYPIGASDSDGGITVTADAIIGDAYNAVVVFTVSRDDGEVFDFAPAVENRLPLGFASSDIDYPGLGGSHGGYYFVDEVPGDNAVQFITEYSADRPISGGTVTAAFEDLFLYGDDYQERTVIAEGKWKLRFDAAYEDASRSLGGGETFRQNGMTYTIDAVTVSPVAIRVEYTVDSEAVWSDAPSGQVSDADRETSRRYFESVEILLTKTDGTVLDLSLIGGSITPGDGVTVCAKSGVLPQILPLEELESVSVGGVVYPVA